MRRPSRIHQGLVGPRELIGTSYLGDPELRREYSAEIAPRTRLALAKVLTEIYGSRGASTERGAPRVLDLGAGTGAAGDAVRTFFGAATTIVPVDRVPAPGVVTADLASPEGRGLGGLSGRFDLIVAAHVLNELFTDAPAEQRIAARARKIAGWCQTLLADSGTLVVIEPALRETSRELLAVRDRLLSGGGLRVVAPCFWTGACPALARERDWCHDAAAGETRGARRVDFSYLVLRRTGETSSGDPGSTPAADPALFRIVSDRLVEKGRLRIFGCGPAGRHPLVRLDRHRSESNRDFDRLQRGDVARVAGSAAAGDGLRIDAQSVVTAVRRP